MGPQAAPAASRPRYPWTYASPEERVRIEAVEALWDPLSARMLERVDVSSGAACLELGAGGGSVARHLCTRVGRAGRVVAADLDVRLLRCCARENLTIVESDVTAHEFPPASFDLVHARLLLAHLPGRSRLLRRVRSWLRPRGSLVVEDAAFWPLRRAVHGTFRRTMLASAELLAESGTDYGWATDLPRHLEAAGYTISHVDREPQVIRGGGPAAIVRSLTLRTLAPALVEKGYATPSDIEETLGLLECPDFVDAGPEMVACVASVDRSATAR